MTKFHTAIVVINLILVAPHVLSPTPWSPYVAPLNILAIALYVWRAIYRKPAPIDAPACLEPADEHRAGSWMFGDGEEQDTHVQDYRQGDAAFIRFVGLGEPIRLTDDTLTAYSLQLEQQREINEAMGWRINPTTRDHVRNGLLQAGLAAIGGRRR